MEYHNLPVFHFYMNAWGTLNPQVALYASERFEIAIVGNHVVYQIALAPQVNPYHAFHIAEKVAAELFEHWVECHVVMMCTLEEYVAWRRK